MKVLEYQLHHEHQLSRERDMSLCLVSLKRAVSEVQDEPRQAEGLRPLGYRQSFAGPQMPWLFWKVSLGCLLLTVQKPPNTYTRSGYTQAQNNQATTTPESGL